MFLFSSCSYLWKSSVKSGMTIWISKFIVYKGVTYTSGLTVGCCLYSLGIGHGWFVQHCPSVGHHLCLLYIVTHFVAKELFEWLSGLWWYFWSHGVCLRCLNNNPLNKWVLLSTSTKMTKIQVLPHLLLLNHAFAMINYTTVYFKVEFIWMCIRRWGHNCQLLWSVK